MGNGCDLQPEGYATRRHVRKHIPKTGRKTFIHPVALSAGFPCLRRQHDCDQMFSTFSLPEGTNTLFEILKKTLPF